MINANQLQEFKKIIFEDYKTILNDKEATKLANDFLLTLEVILRLNALTTLAERSKNDN